MTTLIDRYYSVEYFYSVENDIQIQKTLPESILKGIEELEKIALEIISKETQATIEYKRDKVWEKKPETTVYKKVEKRTHRGSGIPSTTEQRLSQADLSKNWKEKEEFHATQLEKREGIEKIISEIRVILNKISNKNYDAQKSIITEKIETCFTESELLEPEDKMSNIQKISKSIFDIASSNKFYSEIYADLYYELTEKYSVFQDRLEEYLQSYYNSFSNIYYVDSSIDYDGFCNYNKMNDRRRAETTFFLHLMKKGILSVDKIIDITEYIQGFIEMNKDLANKTNEIEELTENLFIIVTFDKIVYSHEKWSNTILPKIIEFSTLKARQLQSVSSRAIFKHKDIISFLEKNKDTTQNIIL